MDRLRRERKRQARISQFYSELPTADTEKAVAAIVAIVDYLGGYDKAAQELVSWLRDLISSGKSPAASIRAIEGLMRLIELSKPK